MGNAYCLSQMHLSSNKPRPLAARRPGVSNKRYANPSGLVAMIAAKLQPHLHEGEGAKRAERREQRRCEHADLPQEPRCINQDIYALTHTLQPS